MAARRRRQDKEKTGDGTRSGGGPLCWEALVKQGIELHDKADKKKESDPTTAMALLREAIQRYKSAEEVMPEGQSSMELRYNMGVAHGTLAGVLKKADTRNAKEQADEAFAQACNCYSEIVEEDPAHADALNNWGAMLSLFAEGLSRDSALTFLSDACDKLTRANELAPADFEVLNNHADALASWAELLSTDASGSAVTSGEVDALWQRAYDVYARVLELAEYDCDKVNCLCNWNDALQRHAAKRSETGDSAGAYGLYQAATSRLEEVVRRQPFDCDGLAALAEAQKSAAECAGSGGASAEEEAGLQAAGATFRRALTCNAAHAESLAGLGETLVDLGRLQMKQGRREEAAATLAASGEVYFRFLQVDPTDTVGLYNMACACALLGRGEECAGYLTRCATAEHAAGADMAQWARGASEDSDLAGVAGEVWFSALLQQAASAPLAGHLPGGMMEG